MLLNFWLFLPQERCMEYILNDLSIEIDKVPATILFVNDLFAWRLLLYMMYMGHYFAKPNNAVFI